jgi:kynurenine formamidase
MHAENNRRVLVDLSHPMHSGMRVYPGDPAVTIETALTVQSDGVNVLSVHIGSQSGTHVDAPVHVRDGLATLDDLPLDRFVGPAALVDVRGRPARARLEPDVLDGVADRLGAGVVVLFVTGWDAHWDNGSQSRAGAYLGHPWPTPQTAQRLVDAGVLTVGIDALSVDRTPAPGEPADLPEALAAATMPTHQVLAAAGCVIAENLRGLDALLAHQDAGADIEVSLLPLRLAAADGAPVRAVATVHPRG